MGGGFRVDAKHVMTMREEARLDGRVSGGIDDRRKGHRWRMFGERRLQPVGGGVRSNDAA